MDSLTSFFDSDFNTLQEQWEKSLVSELKIPDPLNKTSKKLATGVLWPTLSLNRKHEVQLSSESWKKASTTYACLPLEQIEELLSDDLKNGVRNFFFYQESLNEEKWKKVEKILSDFSDNDQIEVFLPNSLYTSSKL
ncbi:MAG: hypothetical protein ACLGHN_16025, partial [Bacteriovoracia bacterium]